MTRELRVGTEHVAVDPARAGGDSRGAGPPRTGRRRPPRPRAGRLRTEVVYLKRQLAVAGAVALLGTLVIAGLLQAGGRVDLLGPIAAEKTRGASALASFGAEDPRPAPVAGPAGYHRLRIVSHPGGALLTLEPSDGSRRVALTPYEGQVRDGDLTFSLKLTGFNPLTERVALSQNRTLDLWLDPEGLLHHKLAETTTGSLPKQVAFSPDGTEIWVTPLGESGLEVYDAHTLQRLGEVDTGDYGTVEVIFSRDGDTVYASQMQTATVFEIDRSTHRIRRQLETGSAWSKVMALSPNEKSLFVANWSGNDVTEIDLRTGTVRRHIPTVDTPRGLYVTPDGDRLFVAGFDGGELQRIDLDTGLSEVLLTTGGAIRHLVGDPKRGLLYADDMVTDEVFVVDLETEDVSKLADTDHTPNTMDLSPDGRVLYVSDRGENNPVSFSLPGPEWGTILAIDTGTGEVLDAIVGGNQPTGLDVSSNGKLLAYSDFLDNRLSVYEIPGYDTLIAGGGGRAQERFADLEKDS